MSANIEQARRVIVAFADRLAEVKEESFMAHTALGGGAAIMTRRELIPSSTRQRVELIFGTYL